MEHKIESGVPICCTKSKSKHPFRVIAEKMKRGDSVIVHSVKEKNALMAQINKIHGCNSISRSLGDGTYRVHFCPLRYVADRLLEDKINHTWATVLNETEKKELMTMIGSLYKIEDSTLLDNGHIQLRLRC